MSDRVFGWALVCAVPVMMFASAGPALADTSGELTVPASDTATTIAVGTVTTSIDASATDTTATETDTTPSTTDRPTTVAPVSLAVAVAADTALAARDESINYTVTVTNPAALDAPGVSVWDTLPAGVAFVGADAGGTHADGTVSWLELTVPAGGSLAMHLSVVVTAPNIGRVLVNRVSIVVPQSWPAAKAVNPCADDPSAACVGTVVPTIEVLPAGDTSPATAVTPSPRVRPSSATRTATAVSANSNSELAATGLPVVPILAGGALAVLLGVLLLWRVRRRPTAGTRSTHWRSQA